jgi:hypothetical protein
VRNRCLILLLAWPLCGLQASEVTARNGVAIDTSSTINGVTPVAAVNGLAVQAAAGGGFELLSATIDTAGTSLTLVYSAAAEAGTDGANGWSLTMAAGARGTNPGAVTATYSSGAGTSTWTYALARTDKPVNATLYETATLSYTQPGDGVKAVAGGTPLESVSGAAVVNDSTQKTLTLIQQFETTSANWGVGFNGTANGLTAGWARSTSLQMPATARPTAVGFFVSKLGSGDTPSLPNQPVYGFVMRGVAFDAVTAPNELLGGLSTALDAENDTPPKSTPAWMTFQLGDVGSIASGSYIHVGLTTEVISGGNYIGWRTQTFGTGQLFGRENDYPQASSDAANWISTDTTGIGSYRLYSSP